MTVIFTGFAAAFAVLLPAALVRAHAQPGTEVPASPVVRFVVRMLAPFTAMFAFYVILSGHVTPGGGFQGGAILGGLFIVLSATLDPARIGRIIPDRAGPWLRAAAPFAFVLVGTIGAFLIGYYLGFPRSEEMHAVSVAMLTVIEIGIGVGGAAIFAALFTEMEAQ